MNSEPVLTAQQQLDQALGENARLQRALAQAQAELNDFTYSVSHDLRASLRHVNAYVQIIKEELDAQAAAAVGPHLETVNQAARQMGRQIDGLMELSRLAQVAVQPSAVDVGPLVQAVCADLATALAGRVVDWQLAPDFPAFWCDPVLLKQVLTQLLSNAVKFTAPRAVAVIQVTWQMNEAGLCTVTVTDNGVGFNPQYAPKLFHAFQRLHGAREFEGLGMGLALSRKIIERHGGTVGASGAPDAGCSISLTLPLAVAAAPQIYCA